MRYICSLDRFLVQLLSTCLPLVHSVVVTRPAVLSVKRHAEFRRLQVVARSLTADEQCH